MLVSVPILLGLGSNGQGEVLCTPTLAHPKVAPAPFPVFRSKETENKAASALVLENIPEELKHRGPSLLIEGFEGLVFPLIPQREKS